MTRRLWAMALALLGGWLAAAPAQAAVSCSVSAAAIYSVYDALAATDNVNQDSFTVNCTRLLTDAATFNFIAFTDDGLYNNGQNNRAKSSAGNNYIKYDFYTSSSYATNWSKSGKCIAQTLTFGSNATSASVSVPFYAKIPAAQTGLPQGSYTDSVTIYLSYNRTTCVNNATQNATSAPFAVTISNVPACQIATPPGNVSFGTYTAFQASPGSASTTFQVRCSTTLNYTMALDATVGVVAGLNYTLSLSGASGVGNGALQSYSITGSMASGQAGACTTNLCANQSDPRTLTVTY